VCCLAVILGLRESWKLDRHELIAEHATAPQAFKRPLPGSGSFVARRLFPRSRLFAGPYVHHRVVHVRAYGALDERAPRWKLVLARYRTSWDVHEGSWRGKVAEAGQCWVAVMGIQIWSAFAIYKGSLERNNQFKCQSKTFYKPAYST
jgi:hypothetical protein